MSSKRRNTNDKEKEIRRQKVLTSYVEEKRPEVEYGPVSSTFLDGLNAHIEKARLSRRSQGGTETGNIITNTTSSTTTTTTTTTPRQTQVASTEIPIFASPKKVKNLLSGCLKNAFFFLPYRFKNLFETQRTMYLTIESFMRPMVAKTSSTINTREWFLTMLELNGGVHLYEEEKLEDYLLLTFNFIIVDRESELNALKPWEESRSISSREEEANVVKDYLRLQIVLIPTDLEKFQNSSTEIVTFSFYIYFYTIVA